MVSSHILEAFGIDLHKVAFMRVGAYSEETIKSLVCVNFYLVSPKEPIRGDRKRVVHQVVLYRVLEVLRVEVRIDYD